METTQARNTSSSQYCPKAIQPPYSLVIVGKPTIPNRPIMKVLGTFIRTSSRGDSEPGNPQRLWNIGTLRDMFDNRKAQHREGIKNFVLDRYKVSKNGLRPALIVEDIGDFSTDALLADGWTMPRRTLPRSRPPLFESKLPLISGDASAATQSLIMLEVDCILGLWSRADWRVNDDFEGSSSRCSGHGV